MPVPRISKEDLRERLDAADAPARPTLVDARLKYPYEHSTVRLPGAIRIAVDSIDTSQLPVGRDVVVYDSDPDEVTSRRVAAELIRRGYRASVLPGGVAVCFGANFPVEPRNPAGAPSDAPNA
jgi:hypothetical protein